MKGQNMTLAQRIEWAKELKAREANAREAAEARAARIAQQREVAASVAAHTYQGGSGDSLGFLMHLAGVQGASSNAHR
jgi:hypothetical protein